MKTPETGITKEAIQEWKEKWGKVFKSTIDGQEYVWRKLRRKEYVSIMDKPPIPGNESSILYERQEVIATTVVLYPGNIQELVEENAGLATTLADEVITKSGFDIVGTEEL